MNICVSKHGVRPGRGLPILSLCIALSGCAPWQSNAPVTTVSYQSSREQIPRTVGKLRRMAVLQLRLLPQVCEGGADDAFHLVPLDKGARELLSQRKGYELIETDLPQLSVGPGDSTNAALVADLQASMDPARPPGPSLDAWLSRLRKDERVDGLLVLRQEMPCLSAEPALRALIAVGTFGVSELAGAMGGDFAKPYAEFLDVVVFETASSRVIWRNAYGRLEQELVKPPWTIKRPRRQDAFHAWAINYLIEPIEPAVPRLLTR